MTRLAQAVGDICLDTNVLAELLRQFLTAERRDDVRFSTRGTMSGPTARAINAIVESHRWGPPKGVVLCSALAFVEICRKADSMLELAGITPAQICVFIEQPPVWFAIEPFGFDVLGQFATMPCEAYVDGARKPIEAIDNCHAATMRAREQCVLATTDVVLRAAYPREVL